MSIALVDQIIHLIILPIHVKLTLINMRMGILKVVDSILLKQVNGNALYANHSLYMTLMVA